MSEKRSHGRFTLQFNLDDPAQAEAAQILETKGRHKSAYITEAILPSRGCDEGRSSRLTIRLNEKLQL